MPIASIVAQDKSKDFLGAMVDELADTKADEPLMPEDEIEDNQKDLMKLKRSVDFEDLNYGFTGGENFMSPPRSKFSDYPLSYFGYDFFINAPTTFAPVKNVPIPPDYLIGPGDNIKIILFGTQNRQFTLQVTRDGEIFVPEIGSVTVAGLSFSEMKKTIQELVSKKIIGAQINITLGSLRSINIFVLGDAFQPGMYTVSALSTLTNAIFASGGINPTGSLRNIQLKRNGKVMASFDFYNLLLKGDTSDDKRLMAGDVIFIPPITKTVGISGEVSRPGVYELHQDETLDDLIEFAGNLKPKANLSSLEIQRIDPAGNGFKLFPVDLENSLVKSVDLYNGDIFRIYPVLDNMNNAILVTGHALQPGFFPWYNGIRIGDLIASASDLLALTDLRYVLIKRENKLNQNYEFLQVDLEEVFNDSSSSSNILLSDRDEIIFFPAMLTTQEITTKLIQDEYILVDGRLVLENEWKSVTNMRKSLQGEDASQDQWFMDEEDETDPFIDLKPMARGPGAEEEDQLPTRYYEYRILDYCTVPAEMLRVEMVREAIAFKNKENSLISGIQSLGNIGDSSAPGVVFGIRGDFLRTATALTDLCRQQLLEPVAGILARQIQQGGDRSVVRVAGNVYFPGIYPLTRGMNISDAIKAAGGLQEATYNNEIELSRSQPIGKKYIASTSTVSTLDTIAMMDKLQARDVITAKGMTNVVETVIITGEVHFPGEYPISENQTLAELIQRAGGITEEGDMGAALFSRQSVQEADLKKLKEAKEELTKTLLLASQSSGDLGTTETDSVVMLQLTELLGGDPEENLSLGRLVIDLESIMNGSIDDVILEDGDNLIIPKAAQTISVIGEVYVPTTHIYDKGNNLTDYINFSGGVNSFADESSIYLIKSDGSIISPSELSRGGFFKGSRGVRAALEAGDAIVVPLDVKPFSTIAATQEITQIIYQMALAAAAVNSF